MCALLQHHVVSRDQNIVLVPVAIEAYLQKPPASDSKDGFAGMPYQPAVKPPTELKKKSTSSS